MATKTKEVELLRDVERCTRDFMSFYNANTPSTTTSNGFTVLDNLRHALLELRRFDIDAVLKQRGE